MSPEMPYIDKLRISRIVLKDYIEKAPEFDRECLTIALEVMEETIQRAEFIEKITGGQKHE